MTRLIFLYLLLFLIGLGKLYANHDPYIDSLKRELHKSSNIDDRIQLLFDIAWEYKNVDPYLAFDYADQCMQLSDSIGDLKGIASSYSIIGITYRIMGDFDNALENAHKSLEITQELNDPGRESIALNNVGNIYYYMGDFEKALIYYKKALFIKEQIGDEYSISSSLNNIGNVYRDLGVLDSSSLYHNKSLEIDQRIDNKLGVAMNLNNIGMINHDYGKYATAQEKLLSSVALLRNIGDEPNMAAVYNNLALNSIFLDSLQQAERYATKSLEIANKLQLKVEIRSAYKALFMLNDRKSDYESAYFYHVKYKEINDSILDESVRNEVSEIEIKYGVQQQQKEIELLSRKNEIKELENRQQKLENKNMYFLLIGLIGIVLIFLLSSIIIFQKNKYKNQLKVSELEQKFLRSRMDPHFLFNALSSIQSCILTDKPEIAYDYHSKFAKLLRLILIHSDVEVVFLKDDLEALQLYLELEQFRTEDQFSYEIALDPSVDPKTIRIPPMILQPFVENSIWHGVLPKRSKGHISIKIKVKEGMLNISILDNGVGLSNSLISKSNGKKHQSLGIGITKNRLSNHNLKHKQKGSIEITDVFDENNLSCGTLVNIEIAIS